MDQSRRMRVLARRSSRQMAAVVVLLLLVLLAAACGSDDDSSKASSDSPTTAGKTTQTTAKLSGEPIKIGVVAPVNTAKVPQPYVFPLAELATKYVNDKGGVNGRPLELVECDDKTDPAEAAICARTVLQDKKAVALVGGFSTVASSYLPTLDAANTVWYGNKSVEPAVIASPRVYTLAPGPLTFAILGKAMGNTYDKVAFITYDSPSAKPTLDLFKSKGSADVQVDGIFVGFTDTDFTPACLKAKQGGAKVIVGALAPDPWTKLVSDCAKVGLTDVTYATSTSVMSPEFIKLADDNHLKTMIAMEQGGPALAEYDKALKQYPDIAAKIKNQFHAAQTETFFSILSFSKFAKNLDTIDGPSIKAYLDKQTAFETGTTPPLDLSKPGPDPAQPRLFDDAVQIGEVKDGKIVAKSSQYVHLFS